MTKHFINNLQVDLTNCKSYCHSCCCCCWCTSCCCWPGPWWWWWWSWSPICTSEFFSPKLEAKKHFQFWPLLLQKQLNWAPFPIQQLLHIKQNASMRKRVDVSTSHLVIPYRWKNGCSYYSIPVGMSLWLSCPFSGEVAYYFHLF